MIHIGQPPPPPLAYPHRPTPPTYPQDVDKKTFFLPLPKLYYTILPYFYHC